VAHPHQTLKIRQAGEQAKIRPRSIMQYRDIIANEGGNAEQNLEPSPTWRLGDTALGPDSAAGGTGQDAGRCGKCVAGPAPRNQPATSAVYFRSA